MKKFISILIALTLIFNLLNAQKPQIYVVKHGDTYYSISRELKITPSELIKANNSKNLFPGDTLIIPHKENSTNSNVINHIVKNQETLFKIAKKYNVTINEIKTSNNINSNTIKVGQLLKINLPTSNKVNNNKLVDNKIKAEDSINYTKHIYITDTTNNNEKNSDNKSTSSDIINSNPTSPQHIISDSSIHVEVTKDSYKKADATTLQHINYNNAGIVQQQGIGTWLSDADLNFSKSVALHNQATIGTIIKVTNPMNRRSVYAKVIGTFNKNDNNKDAIIIISQSAATLLGILDKRFRINIEYNSHN